MRFKGRNLSQIYKDFSIAQKTAYTTALTVGIFLCIIISLSAYISSDILIHNNSESANRNLELIKLRTNDLLDATEQFTGIVVSNYYIQNALTVSDQSTRYKYDQLVRSILDPITSPHSSVSSIVIYSHDGRAVASSNVDLSDPSIKAEYASYSPSMADAWNYLFWDDMHDVSYEIGGKNVSRAVSLRRNIISTSDGSIIGFAVLNVNESAFTHLYTSLSTEDEIQMMISDAAGNIISSSNDEINQTSIRNLEYFKWIQANRNGSKRFIYNNEEHLVNTCYLERFNWYLVSLYPLDVLLKDSRQATKISLVLGFGLMLIASAIVSYQSKYITLPLRQLSQTVDKVAGGNLDIYLEPYGMDEVGHLTMNFNHMVVGMKNLINQNFFAQKKKREYELQALQAQINPHFLYNTLESICALLALDRSRDARDMVSNLASFYRMVLGKREIILTLRSELEIIEQYISIQKVRYADDLTFDLQIDTQVLDCPVIKLSLQPLVENALYHGIKPKGTPGTITIRASISGTGILVSVEDDGVGMEPQLVESLNQAWNNEALQKGFGVSSVNTRIKLHFGDAYGVHITSRQGKGTCIKILLPAEHNPM